MMSRLSKQTRLELSHIFAKAAQIYRHAGHLIKNDPDFETKPDHDRLAFLAYQGYGTSLHLKLQYERDRDVDRAQSQSESDDDGKSETKNGSGGCHSYGVKTQERSLVLHFLGMASRRSLEGRRENSSSRQRKTKKREKAQTRIRIGEVNNNSMTEEEDRDMTMSKDMLFQAVQIAKKHAFNLPWEEPSAYGSVVAELEGEEESKGDTSWLAKKAGTIMNCLERLISVCDLAENRDKETVARFTRMFPWYLTDFAAEDKICCRNNCSTGPLGGPDVESCSPVGCARIVPRLLLVDCSDMGPELALGFSVVGRALH
ncbi:hypothetical protein Cgig2_020749 [Carnegiea gigantea]|uniref:Uncharacterized protein n=1 Tax=Carnegiea gigantea TaxID=171969 RepID=A0A9Q1JH54_9CARY|nr:hypothetical protein Cgig2_020749 [Carnegiea gigantea]